MLSTYRLIRLTPDHKIKPFDCGDQDLNDFLHTDAHNFHQELIAVTYIIEDDANTIAFFSVLNDKISIKECKNKTNFDNIIKDRFPGTKQFSSYPSVKIGRLGVDCKFQRKGLGADILYYIKYLFINNNKTGCRFITVDAYKKSLAFYEKNDFDYLTEKDLSDHTRLMFFDLSFM